MYYYYTQVQLLYIKIHNRCERATSSGVTYSLKNPARVAASDGRVLTDRKSVPLLWRGSVGGVSPPGSRRRGRAGARRGRLGATPGCRSWSRQSPGARHAPGETSPRARRLNTAQSDRHPSAPLKSSRFKSQQLRFHYT